jgi:hypothetical protein
MTVGISLQEILRLFDVSETRLVDFDSNQVLRLRPEEIPLAADTIS